MDSPPAKSSTKKHSLVILRHNLDAAAIHWTRTGFIFVHAGPNLCQLILNSAQARCLSTKHKRNHSRNSPPKNIRLTSPAKILESKFAKMVGPEFLRFSDLSPFVPAMVWTKENYGRCPWWMYLLYTYTLLRIRKYLQKKIHSSILHDFQVAKCIIIISTFNVLTVYWECGASPPTLPSFLPRFSRELLQGSSNFLWGLAWHFAGFPL